MGKYFRTNAKTTPTLSTPAINNILILVIAAKTFFLPLRGNLLPSWLCSWQPAFFRLVAELCILHSFHLHRWLRCVNNHSRIERLSLHSWNWMVQLVCVVQGDGHSETRQFFNNCDYFTFLLMNLPKGGDYNLNCYLYIWILFYSLFCWA